MGGGKQQMQEQEQTAPAQETGGFLEDLGEWFQAGNSALQELLGDVDPQDAQAGGLTLDDMGPVGAEIQEQAAGLVDSGVEFGGELWHEVVEWWDGFETPEELSSPEDKDALTGGDDPEGSVMMVGAAQQSEVAYDDSFTPALTQELEDNGGDLDAALRALAEQELQVPGADQPEHHPSLLVMGDTATKPGEGNKKIAVYVANEDYDYVDADGGDMDLATPKAETNKLKSTLADYETADHLEDATGDEMGAAYADAVGSLTAGDEAFLYFSGHGAEDGLVGRAWTHDDNDVLDYSSVSSLLSWGMGNGVHVRMVVDACHSGAGTQLARDERANEVAEGGPGVKEGLYLEGYEFLAEYRQLMLDYVHDRAVVVGDAQFLLDEHLALKPDKSDPAWTTWNNTRRELREKRDKAIAAWDAKADELWAGMQRTLEGAAVLLWEDWPPAIADYNTLGFQVNYLDTLMQAAFEGAGG